MLLRARRAGSFRAAFRSVAFGTSFILSFATGGGSAFVSHAAAQTAAPPGNGIEAVTRERAYEQAKQKVDRLFAALDVVNSKVDRSLFEIDALARRLGPDPATMFRFMRDEIRYQPYYGVLRGALGTLISRAGNSLDRSLLLAALLQKAGFQVEISRGTLDQDSARALVARLFEPARPVPSAIPSFDELVPALSQALGVEPAKLRAAAEQANKQSETATKELMDYVNGESATLLDELTKAGVDPGVITPESELIAEAREHYWVRYRNSGAQWTELDPAFADAEPGKTRVAAEDHFAPEAVPEDRYHHLRLTMSLRVAQVEGDHDGSLTDTVLIDQELRVADQQGVDIVLANQPNPAPNFFTPGLTLADALKPIEGYQAVLQVGGKIIPGKSFDLRGKVSAGAVSNGPGPAAFASALGGLGGGLLGGLGGATSAPAPARDTRIVGEWANYAVSSPEEHGKSPIVHYHERDIVAPEIVKQWSASHPQVTSNRFGKDTLRRRLLWSVDLSPVTGMMNTDYTGYLQLVSLAVNRETARSSVGAAYGIPGSQLRSRVALRLPIKNVNLTTSVAELSTELSGSNASSLARYFARPSLVAFETHGADPTNNDMLLGGYDIVTLSPRLVVSTTTNPAGARHQARLLRLRLGVLSTRLEWALAGGIDLAGSQPRPKISNATEVFIEAKKQGVFTAVLQPGPVASNELAELSLSDSLKAELSASLASGHTLMLPVRPVQVAGRAKIAWWEIDGKSGQLRGVMPGGRGQAITEYQQTVISVLATEGCILQASASGFKGAILNAKGLLCIVSGSAVIYLAYFPFQSNALNFSGILLALLFGWWATLSPNFFP